MLPVTRFVVKAVILKLFPHRLSRIHSTGVVSNVSTCPFKTLTFTFCILPCKPSSAATSALTYVLVLASSNRALIFNLRSPFLRYTETVLSATFPILLDVSDTIVVSTFPSAFSPSMERTSPLLERMP